ncbi:MAG: CHAT domain-containing protein [Bryobacteraceae bacterium]
MSLSAARDALNKWGPADVQWGWKFRLLCAESLISLNQFAEASVLLTSAGRPPVALEARWKLDQANAAAVRDPQSARSLLQEAAPLAKSAGDVETLCLVELRLGDLAAAYPESERYYRDGFALSEASRDQYLVARARGNQGYLRARFGRFDEAIPVLEQALTAARKNDFKPLIAAAAGNLGWCYFRLGDMDRAGPLLTEAESLSAQIGNRNLQQIWLGAIGNTYFAKGDLDRAADYQRRAARLAESVGNETWLAIAWSNLSELLFLKRDLAGAEEYNRRAFDIKRRSGDAQTLVYSELNAAKIADGEGKIGEAEADYRTVIRHARDADVPDVLWDAHAWLASLYGRTNRQAPAELEYSRAIETIDREWNKLDSDQWRFTFLAPHLIRFFQDYVDFLIEHGQNEKALQMAESSRARVLSRRLEEKGEQPAGLHLDTLLKATRRSRTVILTYWLAPKRSSVWVIRSGRLWRRDLPPEDVISRLVREYTGLIDGGGDPLKEASSLASDLRRAVLEPVRDLIPDGGEVIMIPDGALHQLNIETVVIPGSRPHYWIEDAVVATAPSLRALSSAGTPDSAASRLLLIGDPIPAGADFPALPNAKKEMAEVAAHFNPASREVFTGADAYPERYGQAGPARFTTIHFAAHAIANRESPLNSAIVLSRRGENFKLYARDVASLPLEARLVTISACKSAGAKAYSGEGLMGFAWAFLQAGAENVIASLWDVDDASAVQVMGRLYTGLTEGRTPAEALRSAKLGLLETGGRYGRPYFWAPLQVYTRRVVTLR